MAYRAIHLSNDPLNYFLQTNDEGPHLRVADVVLRANQDPKEVFAHMIRIATGSKWSHSAILYLLSDPAKGFENTFLIEAKTKGVHIASWRDEVVPFEQFNVGIKRPCLDWYVETPYEGSRHDPRDPEDVPAIGYLRHVRGIAMDHINGLYDHKTVAELAALYAQRAAERHLGGIPIIADAAGTIADLFKKWDESQSDSASVLQFICSGIIQYSYFEALRRRIMIDMDIPEHRHAAQHNLRHMDRVIFRPDPQGLVRDYIHKVQKGELDIHNAAPDDVLDLLKTATPADFNNSRNLEWRYVILKGGVWQIEEAPNTYIAQIEGEEEILEQLNPEHRSFTHS
ncbi:MAG: hypothetical protein NVS4B12_18840 [Ktedonobacteraceae bacterium]